MTVSLQPIQYEVAEGALRRWSSERVQRQQRRDGTVIYTFALTGSTCTNRPIQVLLTVTLDPHGRIQSATSTTAPNDTGCEAMCAFLCDGTRTECGSCDEVIGLTLEQAAFRSWNVEPSGCFCTIGNRRHKWRNVFQTLHYAAANSPA